MCVCTHTHTRTDILVTVLQGEGGMEGENMETVREVRSGGWMEGGREGEKLVEREDGREGGRERTT